MTFSSTGPFSLHVVLFLTEMLTINSIKIRVGHIYASDGDFVPISDQLAIEDLRKRQIIGAEVEIEILYKIGFGRGYIEATQLYEESHVDVLFGLLFSSAAETTSHFGRVWDVPVISYFASSATLDDKTTFPTLARVSPSQRTFADATLHMLQANGWRRFAMIWTDDNLRIYADAIFSSLLQQPGKFELAANHGINSSMVNNITFFGEIMPDLKAKSRIILYVGASLQSMRKFMLAAAAANMTGPEYVFVLVNIVPGIEQGYPWLHGDETERRVIKKFVQNSLVAMTSMQSIETLMPAINNLLNSTQPPTKITEIWNPGWLIRSQDAWQLLGRALNACLEAVPACNWRSGRQLVNFMRNVSFNGATGPVQMSSNADRLNDIIFASLQQSHLTTRFFVTHDLSGKFTMTQTSPFDWRTEDGLPPPDVPKCGFDGSLCIAEDSYTDAPRNTTFGLHRGVRVAVKRCDYTTQPQFKQRVELLKLKSMKETQHDNVNTFVGLYLSNQKSAMFFVWSCCQKGSLQDVLYNGEIHLDMPFKASIMKDIIQGLEFIHRSPVGCHGFLIASNCLVDGRWVVKLSDYAVDEILRNFRQDGSDISRQLTSSQLLGLAPEHLRSMTELGFGAPPTQAGDIYSFGMLLYQIIYREKPFESNQLVTEDEILEQLMHATDVVVRPVVQADPKHDLELRTLTRQCWSELPEDRPNLSRVKSVIFTATAGYANNVVEHMASMLERYANDLEKMVNTRTRELTVERKRADSLLEKMLPKSVAEKLKMGISVEPELFESVTVFISDVVRFTDICAASTPVQVVQMMNRLYSLLDSHIEQREAYKVETIGDAYVVVSGLPIRNGFNHVIEIAELALNVRDALHENQIVTHLSGQRLRVRVGLHTGAVAAGVVGVRMPHYCLFGDTVNVAELMESTGQAMKVHISKKTKLLLERNSADEYKFESRGLTDLKGRGSLETFWLERAMMNKPRM